jgi:adsorption protein B
MVDSSSYLLTFLRFLLVISAVGFFISSLDDLFVDLCHMIRTFYRKFFVLPRHPRFSIAQIFRVEEKPAAILIPAWKEAAIIGGMLRHTLRTLNYSNYHIFVGTYPNDEETALEAEKTRDQCGNVQRVTCSEDGPTSKANCLNHIFQGIRLFEHARAMEFAFFVIHDAEDIIHPLSLRLFNYLIPRRDMVQLPVFPLESEWSRWISGHYIDEFAEFHSKNLSVRELFSKTVPSAGVGFAFSRKVLDVLSGDTGQPVFNIHTMTEDYDFGLRLTRYGLKGIFVNKALAIKARQDPPGGERGREITEYIATRQHFPDKFRAAVRQKARWSLGITLQGWRDLGWRGEWGGKYMLMQDRKALITSQINILWYLVLLATGALWLRAWLLPESYGYPRLVVHGSWLWYLIWIDSGFFAWRLLMRAYYVWIVYDFRQALLSFPRQVVGNFVNWAAACRAGFLYFRHLLTGARIESDKTEHVFPNPEELRAFHRKLGDLQV